MAFRAPLRLPSMSIIKLDDMQERNPEYEESIENSQSLATQSIASTDATTSTTSSAGSSLTSMVSPEEQAKIDEAKIGRLKKWLQSGEDTLPSDLEDEVWTPSKISESTGSKKSSDSLSKRIKKIFTKAPRKLLPIVDPLPSLSSQSSISEIRHSQERLSSLITANMFSAEAKPSEYEPFIAALRDEVRKNRRILSIPIVKKWVGLRWRYLFLKDAMTVSTAVAAAPQKNNSHQPIKQRLYERFFMVGKGDQVEDEWKYHLPSLSNGFIERGTLLICPGFLNGLLPGDIYENELEDLHRDLGIRTFRSDSHPMATCDNNANDIRNAIERGKGSSAKLQRIELGNPLDEPYILLGYSKGTPDALHYIVDLVEKGEKEHLNKIAGLISMAGAVGGSYIANDTLTQLRYFENLPDLAIQKLLKLSCPIISLDDYNQAYLRRQEQDFVGAIQHLTTNFRSEWMKNNINLLDQSNVPLFFVVACSVPEEIPFFNRGGKVQLDAFDPDNDMQLTNHQSQLFSPMSTTIAYVHANHWDLTNPPFSKTLQIAGNLEHVFPKRSALRATVWLFAELGLI